MVGIYYPTEIDLAAEEIETRLVQFGEEAGIPLAEIISLAGDIKDILTEHLIDGGV